MEKIKCKNLVTESILKRTWVYKKDFLPPVGRPLGSVQVPTGLSPVGLSTLCLPTQHCLYFRDFPPSLYRTSVYLPVYPSVWQYIRQGSKFGKKCKYDIKKHFSQKISTWVSKNAEFDADSETVKKVATLKLQSRNYVFFIFQCNAQSSRPSNFFW